MSKHSSDMRVVDRFVDHGAALSFRELCARLLEEEPDCLVLDLDKTTHLKRNLGELLAWELCAHEAYGDSRTAPAPRRFGGRVLLLWSEPVALGKYLIAGARRWALPGIHYLVWGKLASRVAWLRRLAHKRFGASPTLVVQQTPQKVALSHLATADELLLRKLARDVWARYTHDQVITREDLDWVRARHPGTQIVLCSASPRPMLEIACEDLGADAICYSTRERINSGEAKIDRLRQICPEAFEPNAAVIGITDTSYGEDHCWAEHFSCVVDINSHSPFPPIVSEGARVEEVHSALVLTREERRRRNAGESGHLDRRRGQVEKREYLELDRDSLYSLLHDMVCKVSALVARMKSTPTPNASYDLATVLEASRTRLAQPRG
jgi:hypothetical protein